MPNRFKDKTLRSEYDAAMFQYQTKHRNLFRADGTPAKDISTFAHFFWMGFDGGRGMGIGFEADRESRSTLSYAYWRAGQDAAKLSEKPASAAPEATGRWTEPISLKPGKITWQSPLKTGGLKTYVGFINQVEIAKIKHNTASGDYIVSIPGWMWQTDPNAIDGKLGIKESNVIAFRGIKIAKAAVLKAIELHPK